MLNNVSVNLKNMDQVLEYITTLRSYNFNCIHVLPYKVFIKCPYDRTTELFNLDDEIKAEFNDIKTNGGQ